VGNVLDFAYSFDTDPGAGVANNGNVKQIINNLDAARTQSFTYDEMNRVKTALTQGTTGSLCWGLDYSYDIYANLTTVALDPARPSCTWTTLNAGISTSNRITNTGFSYDLAGNVLSDGSFSYTWDAESQLKTAAGVTYTYDGDGRRVQKSSGKLYWYGAGGEVIAESDAAGNITDEYVFFGGQRIARRNVSSGNIYYYFVDHLGSSRVVLQSGQSTACYDADFDPFGGEHIVANTCPQNYKFTGKERDTETGLDYFPARYYGSNMGRWMSPDPIGWLNWQHPPEDDSEKAEEDRKKFEDWIGNPQNMNMYTYVLNNPMNHTDPTGLSGCKAGDKTFTTCTITITYDPKTSKGTLVVTGQNKGDKSPTVLLTSSVVVGGDGHVTPTGTFTATVWEKDHVSTKYGNAANVPWSKTTLGGNAFGPYQLHMKELDSRGIYIHGTMGPGWSPSTWGNSIFLSSTSHGCVRMCNRDNISLHDMMPNPSGNKVIIKTKPNED
jgi:RHS repeat-associated protein